MVDRRVKCSECDWIGSESAILVAANPFDADEIISGCPTCRSVNSLEGACDIDGCPNVSNSGTPMPDGSYAWRCYDHWPTEYITIPKMRMGLVPKDEAKGHL